MDPFVVSEKVSHNEKYRSFAICHHKVLLQVQTDSVDGVTLHRLPSYFGAQTH